MKKLKDHFKKAAEIGCLETGCCADFLVCDADWNLKLVFMDGVRI